MFHGLMMQYEGKLSKFRSTISLSGISIWFNQVGHFYYYGWFTFFRFWIFFNIRFWPKGGKFYTIQFQMVNCFLSNSKNKDTFNKYLARKPLEMYQNEQTLVVTYENTAFTSKPTCNELHQYMLVCPCETEEANQKMVRLALSLLRNGWKCILIHTIDTNVVNVVI